MAYAVEGGAPPTPERKKKEEIWTEKLGETRSEKGKKGGRKKGKRKKKGAQREKGREKENKIAENRENLRKINIIRAFYLDVFQKKFRNNIEENFY